jgi:hypothetical protein
VRTAWHSALSWLGLSLCYLAFAGSGLSTAEGVAAVLTGAFAAFLSLGLRSKAQRRLTLRGRWAGVLARLSLQLARDTRRVAATLLHALFRGRGYRGQVVAEGEWPRQPIGSGRGRRAAAALLASLTPDSIALDTGDETLPVHRLSRVSEPTRPRHRAR